MLFQEQIFQPLKKKNNNETKQGFSAFCNFLAGHYIQIIFEQITLAAHTCCQFDYQNTQIQQLPKQLKEQIQSQNADMNMHATELGYNTVSELSFFFFL